MKPAHDDVIEATGNSPRARVVYTHAPVLLGRLLARRQGGWLVSLGGVERELACDAAVDPALLEETIARSGRVLVETAGSDATIVGVVQTQRALTISPEGEIIAEVSRFLVKARSEILLSSPRAFLRVKGENLELYGGEVLTRAREVAKILGRLISLN